MPATALPEFHQGQELQLAMRVRDWFPETLRRRGELDAWSYAWAEIGVPRGRNLEVVETCGPERIRGEGQELVFAVRIREDWAGPYTVRLCYGDQSGAVKHEIESAAQSFRVVEAPPAEGEAEEAENRSELEQRAAVQSLVDPPPPAPALPSGELRFIVTHSDVVRLKVDPPEGASFGASYARPVHTDAEPAVYNTVPVGSQIHAGDSWDPVLFTIAPRVTEGVKKTVILYGHGASCDLTVLLDNDARTEPGLHRLTVVLTEARHEGCTVAVPSTPGSRSLTSPELIDGVSLSYGQNQTFVVPVGRLRLLLSWADNTQEIELVSSGYWSYVVIDDLGHGPTVEARHLCQDELRKIEVR